MFYNPPDMTTTLNLDQKRPKAPASMGVFIFIKEPQGSLFLPDDNDATGGRR